MRCTILLVVLGTCLLAAPCAARLLKANVACPAEAVIVLTAAAMDTEQTAPVTDACGENITQNVVDVGHCLTPNVQLRVSHRLQYSWISSAVLPTIVCCHSFQMLSLLLSMVLLITLLNFF